MTSIIHNPDFLTALAVLGVMVSGAAVAMWADRREFERLRTEEDRKELMEWLRGEGDEDIR